MHIVLLPSAHDVFGKYSFGCGWRLLPGVGWDPEQRSHSQFLILLALSAFHLSKREQVRWDPPPQDWHIRGEIFILNFLLQMRQGPSTTSMVGWKLPGVGPRPPWVRHVQLTWARIWSLVMPLHVCLRWVKAVYEVSEQVRGRYWGLRTPLQEVHWGRPSFLRTQAQFGRSVLYVGGYSRGRSPCLGLFRWLGWVFTFLYL